MRLFSKLFIGLFAFMIMGCTALTDEAYTPSIAALSQNETLVMKYSACHSGCDKGTIKFKDNRAILGRHTLKLSPDEVRDLDRHFLSADGLSEDYFCSLRIMISFKKKSALKLPVKKKAQQYPCIFADLRDSINPETLLLHFNETPNEVPFWRLPDDERILTIED